MNARGEDDVGPDQRQGHQTSGNMKCEMYDADNQYPALSD